MTRFTTRWIPALVIAATLTASCATAPPKLAEQPAAESAKYDEIVASSVYSALQADPIYYFRHVDVKVDDGVARLSGLVWSADAIYRARAIASKTPGVTRVVTSGLELERNGRDTGPAR